MWLSILRINVSGFHGKLIYYHVGELRNKMSIGISSYFSKCNGSNLFSDLINNLRTRHRILSMKLKSN